MKRLKLSKTDSDVLKSMPVFSFGQRVISDLIRLFPRFMLKFFENLNLLVWKEVDYSVNIIQNQVKMKEFRSFAKEIVTNYSSSP